MLCFQKGFTGIFYGFSTHVEGRFDLLKSPKSNPPLPKRSIGLLKSPRSNPPLREGRLFQDFNCSKKLNCSKNARYIRYTSEWNLRVWSLCGVSGPGDSTPLTHKLTSLLTVYAVARRQRERDRPRALGGDRRGVKVQRLRR